MKVSLHWYDLLSKEGLFKTSEGELIFANFEWSDTSHDLASRASQGQEFEANIVFDTSFTQVESIK